MDSKSIGALIRNARGKKSLRVFAEQCGISHTHLDSIEKGSDPRTGKAVSIGLETLEKLSLATGIPIQGLASLTMEPDDQNTPPPSTGGKWIPVLGDVAGGIPIEAVQDIIGHEEISLQMAQQGEHFGLRVRGDSMEPRICDGDVVIVRQQPSAEDGDVAVVLVNGDVATVKKIKHSAGGIMLIPNNPKHETMFYSGNDCEKLPVVILGKVVELRGKFK